MKADVRKLSPLGIGEVNPKIREFCATVFKEIPEPVTAELISRIKQCIESSVNCFGESIYQLHGIRLRNHSLSLMPVIDFWLQY